MFYDLKKMKKGKCLNQAQAEGRNDGEERIVEGGGAAAGVGGTI